MPVTRFAPAPTGYLHLGHVVSAIWVWGLARSREARVLLRIEDHDRGRCRPEYEQALLEDLGWLGFIPDHSTAAALRQSTRGARYAERLTDLEARGLVYPCDCSRGDIGHEPRYPGTCRTRDLDPRLIAGRRVRIEPGVESFDDLRLGPQSQEPEAQCGDFLLRDRSGNYTYQFCNVVDDVDQGVDLVIRGEDLLDSTGRQLRLRRLLGGDTPPHYLHHPLVRGADGRKLSKSDGSTGVRELRAAGHRAEDVLGRAARLAGLHPSGAPIEAHALAALFG